ncbi:hypothetical protein DMUE_2501 [Dictyocoela muelleri]|nr:hypothetical protein DMUE_2501 [Dictyocoela muelleri]
MMLKKELLDIFKDEKNKNFIVFFEKTYLRYPSKNQYVEPKYKICFWNAHLRSKFNILTTINNFEAWHRVIRKRISISHFYIAFFFSKIMEEDQINEFTLKQNFKGNI